MDSNALPDEVFTRYLLRSLSEEESERIDEMSVTDDGVAWRLRAAEDDLVDAYVRGELTGAQRARFEAVYLATPARRNRLARARALAHAADAQLDTAATWWKWAIAAALAIAIPSFWLLSTLERNAPPQAPVPVAAAPTATIAPDPPTVTAAPPPSPTTVVSLLLPPPTRASRGLATVPSGVDEVVLRAQLESNDYPRYRGQLRNLQQNRIVWRSGTVAAVPDGDAEVVALSLPGSILEAGNYSLELSGMPSSGRAELITSYAFSVNKD